MATKQNSVQPPTLDESAIQAAGKLQFHSLGHLLVLAQDWPEAACAALGVLGALLKDDKPIPLALREYFAERLLAASKEPNRAAQLLGVRGSRGRSANDDLCRNLRIVELVRQLAELGYVLSLDVPQSAFEAASKYLLKHGVPIASNQVKRVWGGRRKYTI